MSKYHRNIRISVLGIVLLGFTSITFKAIAQDTLAGDYNTLTIKAGLHIIKETVTVKGKLEIQAGAMELNDGVSFTNISFRGVQ